MSHVFHRSLRERYPVAVGGDGPYLIDRDGKRYLDGSAGSLVMNEVCAYSSFATCACTAATIAG